VTVSKNNVNRGFVFVKNKELLVVYFLNASFFVLFNIKTYAYWLLKKNIIFAQNYSNTF